MMRRPLRSTRTYTHFPSTTLSRSVVAGRRSRRFSVADSRDAPAVGLDGTYAADRSLLRPLERRCRGERRPAMARSEEHTSELQSLMCITYAVFCLKKKQ